ncbi:hypothetical protein O181_010037 [Austropuccinia psidii MF-1]|uniref:Uncharacterized protein n=1 Tax=Austropuccinia psidii MF-1 TaxID=1389203 RepID=A0A9Q3GKU3_9BASI|nr:hypothetical protein [Austropuccinia psidii MF-1]
MNIIQLNNDDSAAAMAKIENWGIWKTPTISSANEPLLNNCGLRNTKQRTSRTENNNQDDLREHPKVETPIKKRQNIPGAHIEYEKNKEEKTIIPNKYKKSQQVQNEKERHAQEHKSYHT